MKFILNCFLFLKKLVFFIITTSSFNLALSDESRLPNINDLEKFIVAHKRLVEFTDNFCDNLHETNKLIRKEKIEKLKNYYSSIINPSNNKAVFLYSLLNSDIKVCEDNVRIFSRYIDFAQILINYKLKSIDPSNVENSSPSLTEDEKKAKNSLTLHYYNIVNLRSPKSGYYQENIEFAYESPSTWPIKFFELAFYESKLASIKYLSGFYPENERFHSIEIDQYDTPEIFSDAFNDLPDLNNMNDPSDKPPKKKKKKKKKNIIQATLQQLSFEANSKEKSETLTNFQPSKESKLKPKENSDSDSDKKSSSQLEKEEESTESNDYKNQLDGMIENIDSLYEKNNLDSPKPKNEIKPRSNTKFQKKNTLSLNILPKGEEKNTVVHEVKKMTLYFSKKKSLITFELMSEKPYKQKVRIQDYLNMLYDFIENNEGKNLFFNVIEGLTKRSKNNKIDLSSGGSIKFAKGSSNCFLNFHYPHDHDGKNSEFVPETFVKEYMTVFEFFKIKAEHFNILNKE